MASSLYDSFKDLDISRDELNKIGEALKNEEFRKLLVEYCDEVTDPANKKLFQDEITQLEKERGNDVTFINPTPGYVIKTSVDGAKKGFINICANDNVDKPISNPDVQDGSRGLRWSLPHSLAQPREDCDKKNKRCVVYDVVFHPNTLHLAAKNKAFYSMVNLTACDAVEKNFDVKLDKKNLKFPKMQYKGIANPAIIRKKVGEPKEMSAEEEDFFKKIYPPRDVDKKVEQGKRKSSPKDKKSSNDNPAAPYTTPTFLIKHRDDIDFQQFTEHKEAKMNAATPKELVVEIQLPLLRSATDMDLDVAEKTVSLISEKPAKYKLDLTLPYAVHQDSGSAKFDKDAKKLTIILPVKRNTGGLLLRDMSRDDSGVESDHGSSPPSESASDFVEEIVIGEDTALRTTNNKSANESFLSHDCHYILPEHNCHFFENTVAFTLNVKNVDSESVKSKTDDGVHVKFSSVSSGFFPIHYAFYVKFHQSFSIDSSDNVHVETWDNNVVVQIHLDKNSSDITSYLYGLSEDSLNEKSIEEPSVLNNKFEHGRVSSDDDDDDDDNEEKPYVEVNVEDTEVCITIQPPDEPNGGVAKKNNRRNDHHHNQQYSESSGDELSLSGCSQSPVKGRGILKRLSTSRSVSESSVDDFTWASSFENCAASLDSVIPEEAEEDASASLKKTVRFNDVVSRQLFRSNSSILGQKKKNQRKNRNKKRANERRHSESEVSEAEEKNGGDSAEDNVIGNGYEDFRKISNAQSNTGKQSDLIFHLDM